jgi:hypothetical protein
MKHNLKSLIIERLTDMGAASYSVHLPPYIEEIIREKVDKKTEALEREIKEMVSDRVVARAFKAHTAAQKEKLNPTQKDLFHDQK